jgi:hypothetical protein
MREANKVERNERFNKVQNNEWTNLWRRRKKKEAEVKTSRHQHAMQPRG